MMTRRQKAVLHLLGRTGPISKIRLVKLMFLASEHGPFYDFVPYQYGPFSFQLYHDLARLQRDGMVAVDDETVTPAGTDHPGLDGGQRDGIDACCQRFAGMNDSELVNFIYDRYPQFTVLSNLGTRKPYERDETGIVTIGYEGRSIDAFMNELVQHKVNVLVDVRRNAWSRKFGYMGYKLKDYLGRIGIEYLPLPELGISTSKRKDLATDEDYKDLFAEYEKELEGKAHLVERIRALGRSKKIALMCFEREARRCHRGVIAERLRQGGTEVGAL